MNSSLDFFPEDGFEPGVPYYDAFTVCRAVMPLLIDVSSLALMLAISKRTAWRLVERGELPRPLHVGKLARWRVVDVVAFVDLLQEQEAMPISNHLDSAQPFPYGDQEKLLN